MQANSPGAHMPAGQPSMQVLPLSETKPSSGPLLLLFWVLVGSVTIGVKIGRKWIRDRHQTSASPLEGGAVSQRPSLTTFLNAAQENLELGMHPPPAKTFQIAAE